ILVGIGRGLRAVPAEALFARGSGGFRRGNGQRGTRRHPFGEFGTVGGVVLEFRTGHLFRRRGGQARSQQRARIVSGLDELADRLPQRWPRQLPRAPCATGRGPRPRVRAARRATGQSLVASMPSTSNTLRISSGSWYGLPR